ncbi:ATP-binding cassette domain-containing protein [Pseudalkalibacillus sp. R45]|uniref:ATP-binding cassette domain-containing protein n=1 Tax=Pseudalkalibacillus sp. R45 TaxID=3457433 RepID=UPI003FCDDA7F
MSMITVRNLNKQFDGKHVVKNVDFKLNPGMCVALLGPNGAGKTTTLRMLSGLIRPTSGSIMFEGLDDTKDIRRHIGYLPQYPAFHEWMTGKEFLIYVGQLAYLPKTSASSKADELLKIVGISDAATQRIKKYSGGMRQRLGIAQALIHEPKLLMLDEPVSALDPIGRREVLTLMEKLKEHTTLLFSTHILNDAEEISDELLVMHHGEILEAGSIHEVRAKHQVDKIDLCFGDSTDRYSETFTQLDSVERVEMNKECLHVFVSNLDEGRKEILEIVKNQGLPLTKFELARTTLEDMFMKVVQK